MFLPGGAPPVLKPSPPLAGDPGRRPGEVGQAAVELVALLPLLVVVALLVWQSALAGQAAWAAGQAASAGARAHAVGGDPARAARDRLPRSLRGGLEVRRLAAGGVRVKVEIPSLVRGVSLGAVRSSSALPEQRR